MNLSSILLGLVAFLVICALLVGGCAMQGRNEAVSLDEEVKEKWADVETQLERRYDLIPNIVETVKGTALQEKTIFVAIAEARSGFRSAMTTGSTVDRVRAANNVENALAAFRFPVLLQENYPDLKSNGAFLRLMDQLEGTENRIAVSRQDYNNSVRSLNKYVRGFPSGIWCNFAGVTTGEYFKAAHEAKNAPKVDFTGGNKGEPKPETPADAPADKKSGGK